MYYVYSGGGEATEPPPHSLQTVIASYGRFATLTQGLTSLVGSMCMHTVTHRI